MVLTTDYIYVIVVLVMYSDSVNKTLEHVCQSTKVSFTKLACNLLFWGIAELAFWLNFNLFAERVLMKEIAEIKVAYSWSPEKYEEWTQLTAQRHGESVWNSP